MKFTSAVIDLDTASLETILARVYNYWDDIRANSAFPSWRDVDMMMLPLDIVPWCSVVDVVSGGDDFSVRFWGTKRVRLLGVDYTGQLVSRFKPAAISEKILDELRQVVQGRCPLLVETSLWSADRDAAVMTFRVLRLPFGEGEKVKAILNVPKYPANPKAMYNWFGTDVPVSVIMRQQPPDGA